MAGAALAGCWVPLAHAARVLPLGVLLGVAVPLAAQVNSVCLALPALVLVGALGGALVVPLNALLQHRRHLLLSAGRGVAVQNFNENASVLLMLAVYAALLALGLPVRSLMVGLGLFVGLFMALLMAARWWRRLQRFQRLQSSQRLLPPARTGTR